jgi:hypothetical protein
VCKRCQNEYVRAQYKANRRYYLKKARSRNVAVTRANIEYLIAYLKEHPCVDCGESDIVVLDFDHQRDKVELVSLLTHGYSLERLKREIDKCEVVCANCHRRRTAKQFGWRKLAQQ